MYDWVCICTREVKLMSRIIALMGLLLCSFMVTVAAADSAGEWIQLFDGKSLEGWKASEKPGSFRIEDGAIVCDGPRSHLFYMGKDGAARFKHFELTAEVMTTPGSNSGIYFHTEYQQEGWPSKGYESQVVNSNRVEPGNAYVEHKMTGSLYAVRNTWKATARDNEWFRYRIRVEGKTIRIWINDAMTVDYTEPDTSLSTCGDEGPSAFIRNFCAAVPRSEKHCSLPEHSGAEVLRRPSLSREAAVQP